LSMLPSLSVVARSLQTASWPSVGAEFFDLDAGAWRGVPAIEHPGAYRFRRQAWLYAYVSRADVTQRQMRVCDARLAKFLAAAEGGRSLMGYERDRLRLIVPWGARLPGLYERV